MNYSDYDSDGYSSNEDADYVPSDDNLSEDDMNECVKEDPLDESSGVPHPDDVTKRKRKKKVKENDIGMRKRKKGGLKLEEEENEGGDERVSAQAEEKEEKEEEEEKGGKGEEADDKKKKKDDDLWASFLSDVGSRPKPSSPPTKTTTPSQKPVSSLSGPSPARSAEPSKITITKVLDFAGEEVRVTKEVSSDSREAKSFLKSQEEEKKDTESPTMAGPSRGRRPGGMANILGKLGKKQKMSTLEKSKMDWDAFKEEEGISDELAIHNRGKEGYVERKNFLERVDHRQFELEKAVRLSHMKPR